MIEDMQHGAIAGLLFDEAMLGGPDGYDDDPLKHALYWLVRQYIHGACATMARHLNETLGLPVVALEARHKDERDWHLRHYAVTRSQDRVDLSAYDGGYAIEILDAAGGGTFEQRKELYYLADHDFRILYADDPECRSGRFMTTNTAKMGIEDDVAALPGLTMALGMEFDLRRAVEHVLPQIEKDGRLDEDILDGIRDYLARSACPAP